MDNLRWFAKVDEIGGGVNAVQINPRPITVSGEDRATKSDDGTPYMPILHHGTSRLFAVAMAGTPATGTIDLGRGEGEFGPGFYTQDSGSNAARRGYSIYGNSAATLILTIDDQAYHALRFKRLTLNMAQMLNARLVETARRIYTTTHDAIVGPLVYDPKREQQKFQSANAGTLLNGTQTKRTVR